MTASEIPSGLIICVIVLIVAASQGCTKKEERTEPTGWNNLSELQKEIRYGMPYKFRELSNTTNARNVENPHSTIILVIGLDSAITPVERSSLIEYVKSGGTLVFASDRAELAEKFTRTFRIRYYKHELIDRNYEYNYDFIFSDTDHFGQNLELMFNGPVGLNISDSSYGLDEPQPGPVDPDDVIEDANIERVIATSPIVMKNGRIVGFSYVDLNDNGEFDTWDQDGPIALGYRVERGEGAAYIFGNSGLFLNQMLVKNDNLKFINEIISASIPVDGTVYVDTTHHSAKNSHHLHLPD